MTQQLTKQKNRADPHKHENLKQTDSKSKRKNRADPDKHENLKQTDSKSKRRNRADPHKHENLKQIDGNSKRKNRADPDKHKNLKQTDSTSKRKNRADPDKHENLKQTDSTSKRKNRADPDKHENLKQTDSKSKRKTRADPDKHENLKQTENSTSKRKNRADPDKHENLKQTDSKSKRKNQADPDKHQKQKQIDNNSKRKNRVDPDKHDNQKQTDRKSKRKNRADPDKHQKQKQTDNKSKQKNRSVTSFQEAIEQFRNKCSQMPVFTCCVCNRLLFRQQVKCCNILKFPNKELILCCIYANNMHKPQTTCKEDCKQCPKWICFICNHHLMKNNIPNQSSLNHLNLDKQPNCLQTLNNLEKHLVSSVIPFMKIVSLPKGSQKGIHGPVVCVPSNISSTVQTLPRQFTDSTIITVKLKRKLEYKGHHLYQQVSVNKIHEALLYLKQKSPHFSGIDIEMTNVTSTTEPILAPPDVPVTVTHPETISTPTTQQNSQHEPAINSVSLNFFYLADSDDISDDIHETSAPMVSCLEPEDLTQTLGPEETPDSVFCVASGQGFLPMTVFNMESQAFPYLFPTGKNTFSQSRNIKLGLNRYFNNRLFSADSRFASDPQYIFYSQYVSELNTINSSVSIAMRKSSSTTFDQQHLTATQLRDPETRKQILSSDKCYQFLSTSRGSPPYWEKTLKDLFAMVKQFNNPTCFCSFSAADRRWPEIVTAICTQQGKPVPEDLDWPTYTNIINSNPVTACRMFQNRVLSFITDLILSLVQPIGEVSDFFYRTEFQSRGWPHIHCLFWCSDAPSFDPNTSNNEDFINYIDKYITCNIPDQQSDPELFEIVTSVQMHSKRHSKSCRKGSKQCRFNFPRPVSLNTFIAVPTDAPDNIPLGTYKKAATNTLSAVWDMINSSQEEDTQVTVSAIFEAVNITPDQYRAAHCALATKNTVVFKRNITECWVNPYNSHLLRAWNGNMDIQPVLDVYSCIMYIVSYISKAERELGDLLRNAQKEANEGHLEPVKQLRKLGNVYLNSREVSIMEAVYRVTGMHLKQSSRQVFIPVDRHSIKLSKPLKYLREQDENIWMTSLTDRYLARPTSSDFEQICLAKFARDYCIKDRTNQNTDHLPEQSTNTAESNVYTLQNNLGTIMKRKKPAVIRYMKVNKDKKSEDYYHNILRLYFPHRSKELKPINFETFEEMFQQLSPILLPMIAQFEKLSQDLDEAWRSLQERGFPEDAWADVAPNQEPSRREDDEELQNALRLFKDNAQEKPEEDIPDFSPNHTAATSTYHIDSQHAPSNSHIEQRNRLRNINHQQAQIFHFVRTWARIKEHGDNVKPFYIFLTGGAGTGKSFTIKSIYHEVNRTFTRPSGNPDLPVVLLVSYTGTAAFNINGQTIHSAFSINRGMSKVLPEDSANTLRSNLQDLQLLIIDEVSMFPADLLNLIHCRLQQIKQPFSSSAYFEAVDMCHDSKTQKTFKRNQPLDVKNTNLRANIIICCGARVMLTMNIDVADGLTNGAMGTVTSVITQTCPLGLPDAVCVLFQEERVGLKSRTSVKPPQNVDRSSTVIVPQTELIQSRPFQVTRHQYPLMLAWAVTTHKNSRRYY
ncbi:uncharacterized protein LOC128559306 [Mercenaria mercenaria]|uniref:uncharacterized protein LOC128559306 n=1 Tax=Mercenaria mercenaria TaxID=6596 RepID=UPI00234E6310|nr:uncharacterized protein LOC128559306 [Mercenaria mercenaria]